MTGAGARPLSLRSGDRVWVRPIRAGDAPELRRAFEQLSARSRYQRFFTGMPTLSDAMLRILTEVDHVDDEALVATPAGGSSTIIGVARFVRDRTEPTTADLALTVADEWHGRGLGSRLLAVLSDRASELGIAHFTADMLADNRAVLALVRAAGGTGPTSGGTTVTSRIDIGGADRVVACDAVAVLRTAARGQLLALPRALRELIPEARPVAKALLLPSTAELRERAGTQPDTADRR